MALNDIVVRNFGAGELAPGLSARADLALYQKGLRTCRNFLIQKHGGVSNRTGTKYITAVKTGQPWLLKYVFNSSLTYVIEAGAGYFRFFHNGAPVTVSSVDAWVDATVYIVGSLVSSGGTNYVCITAHTSESGTNDPPNDLFWYALTDDIYEIPTPFLANLHLLRATQDQNILTLTHKDYVPHELINDGSDTAWRLEEIVTQPGLLAPGGILATAGPAGSLTFSYMVTAIDEETGEESEPSIAVELTNVDNGTEEDPHIIEWDPMPEAIEYRVYKDEHVNGTFGYIGTATDVTTFNDTGFAPDYALTPPVARELFWATLNFPHTAAYYQQRRVFANTHMDVGTTWASQTGFYSNFSIHSPIQDDDAVTFKLSGRQVLGIQHLVGLKRLLILTDGGEWIVLGGDDGVLTPSTIHPEQEGHAGSAASPVPVVLGRVVIFTQYLSHVVRALTFTESYEGFESFDLTTFAGHLFTLSTIIRMDGQVIPYSVVWCVRSEGTLLTLTYVPDTNEFGWSQQTTGDDEDDLFLDVCVVPEGDEHAVYVITQRTVDGDTVRYIERFAQRLEYESGTLPDAFFVDAGITYDGAATTSITGLDHLEGRPVMAWTETEDGVLTQGPFTVASGEITLTTEATKAQVGLRITAQLKTLALDIAGTDVRAKQKRIQKIVAIVERSLPGFFAGPDEDHLHPVKVDHPRQDAGVLRDGQFEVSLTGAFTAVGETLIQHTNPTPLTILGLIPSIEVPK